MEFTAKRIAEYLNGEVVGNPNEKISNVSRIEEGKPGALAFLANPKYEKYIYNTQASVVIVNRNFEPSQPVSCTLIKVDNSYQAIADLLEMKEKSKPAKTGIDKSAYTDPSSGIGKDVYIGHFSVVSANTVLGNNVKIYPQTYIGENVTIGENTIIYPGVKIYNDCIIGKNCIIHAGSVLGSDGFGFAPMNDNNYKKIPQIGNVILEDNVEIGANTTIDRAMMGSTIIRRGTKLDNLIQVAHNVNIGENTVIAAQSGIAGSARIGSNCMFGGQVGVSGHLTVASGVKAAAQSGIASSITKDNEVVQGSPSLNAVEFKRSYVMFKKLPEIGDKISRLEEQIEELKKKL